VDKVQNLKHLLPPDAASAYVSQAQIEQRLSANTDHELASVAHVLVSERHSKFDLVHLVEFLLCELKAAKQTAAETSVSGQAQ